MTSQVLESSVGHSTCVWCKGLTDHGFAVRPCWRRRGCALSGDCGKGIEHCNELASTWIVVFWDFCRLFLVARTSHNARKGRRCPATHQSLICVRSRQDFSRPCQRSCRGGNSSELQKGNSKLRGRNFEGGTPQALKCSHFPTHPLLDQQPPSLLSELATLLSESLFTLITNYFKRSCPVSQHGRGRSHNWSGLPQVRPS